MDEINKQVEEFGSQEVAKCDFCGEQKPVLRYYVRIKNKHFDDNEQGKYSNYFSYCKSCGIEDQALLTAEERERERIISKAHELESKERAEDTDGCAEVYTLTEAITNITEE